MINKPFISLSNILLVGTESLWSGVPEVLEPGPLVAGVPTLFSPDWGVADLSLTNKNFYWWYMIRCSTVRPFNLFISDSDRISLSLSQVVIIFRGDIWCRRLTLFRKIWWIVIFIISLVWRYSLRPGKRLCFLW